VEGFYIVSVAIGVMIVVVILEIVMRVCARLGAVIRLDQSFGLDVEPALNLMALAFQIEEVVAENVVIQVPTEWNPELFRSGLTNALKAKPEANCVFAASDFAYTAIQAALEGAGRYAPTGDAKHIWLATNDLLPAAVKPMEGGYIDVSVTWDAYRQAKEAVRVAIAVVKGQDPQCGGEGCLAKGRLVTPQTIGTIDNLWSRDYK
jgi:ABC-type sugar transport system substrate-binding protein